MTLDDILSTAVSRGVTFLLEGDGLGYHAPRGAMTKEFRDAVISHKQELISALKRASAATIEAPIPRTPIAESEPAPLSSGQQRLWLIHRLLGSSPLYNVHVRLEWSGALDRPALERALSAVVCRHPSLRTTFREVDGQPRAMVSPPAPLPVTHLDLRDLVDELKPRATERFAREQRQATFDLERGPLLRVAVITLQDEEHVLLVTQHHIITDAWSFGLFFSELGEQLEVRVGVESRVAPEPLRYTDYARWEQERRGRPEWNASLAWWRERLAGLQRLALPYAHRPRSQSAFAGDAYTFCVSPAVTARLKDLARTQRCTLYVVLLTAWAILLHRLTSQTTFAIGTVSSGRDREELRDVIGFFVNTLALRVDLSGDPSAADAIDRLRTEFEASLAHELPFGDVVSAVGAPRGPSLNPLVQACLVFENVPPPEAKPTTNRYRLALDTLNGSVEGTAKFDLNLVLKEEDTRLLAQLEYSSALFEPSTIERAIGHFCTLLEDLGARPNTPVSELRILSERERERLVTPEEVPALAVPSCAFHQLFEAQVARAPDSVALVTADGRLTYRELDQRANRLAHHLRKLGVGPDALVGLWLAERNADLIVGMLGIAKAGGAYVPLDPKQPAQRNCELIEGAGIRFLVTDSSLEAAPASLHLSCVRLDSDAAVLAAEPSARPLVPIEPSRLAYVIFTSGSTGKPKGVAIEHRNLVHYITALGSCTGLPSNTSYAHVSTFAADLGHTTLFSALCTGGCLHLLEQKLLVDPVAFGAYFEAHAIDCLKIVPSHLSALLSGAHPERVLPRKLLILGGEALRWELLAQIRRLAPSLRILNHYGPTETTVGVLTFEVRDSELSAESATVPLGRPLPQTRAYVLDRALQPVPIGARGELYIGGPQLARGYSGQPELTAERFLPDPFDPRPDARVYRTGDIVRRLSSGEIEFLGRADHQLKVRGFRVEPGEIEATLAAHPAVRSCVVVPHVERDQEVRLAAYAVAEASPDGLRSYLKERLPEYMVPSWILLLEAMPLGPNGKLDRRQLPSPTAAPQSADRRPPRTPTERLLARAWQDVLVLDSVEVDSNFFDLGGHSLLMVRLHSKLQELSIQAPELSVLFERPTIEALASYLDQHSSFADTPREVAPSTVTHAEQQRPATGPRLVELRAGHPKRVPLFLVHGAGGVETSYLSLAARLDAEQPVYAVRADFDGLDPCLERLAARYLELIRARAPRGPYLLGGASFGGLLAYEMAQQLRHQREAVGPLSLIDTEEPGQTKSAPQSNQEIVAFLSAMAPDLIELLLLPRASRPAAARDLFPEPEDFLRNYRQCAELRARYSPAPCPCDVVFFRASDRRTSASEHPERAWEPLVQGRLTVIDVPGNHMAMLQHPHVETLARHLTAHLTQFASSTRGGLE